jgi:hypothetical protein
MAFQLSAGQNEHAAVVRQRDPVGECVDQFPQHARDDFWLAAVRCTGSLNRACCLPGARRRRMAIDSRPAPVSSAAGALAAMAASSDG